MADYFLALTTSAEKELHRLSHQLVARIAPRIENLGLNPRPRGCKKLKGSGDEWRIRIGDYRVVYIIDDKHKNVEVTRIAHRRDVYEP